MGTVNERHLESCINELNNYSFAGFKEEYVKSNYFISKVLGWQKLPIIFRFNDLPKRKLSCLHSQ